MNFTKLEQFIYDKMAETRLPSVTAAIVQDGKVIWSKAFGFSNLESGIAATTRSSYCIGSVTKCFTSLAIMQLAEQGKLSLEDPIEKHVPFAIKPFGETVRIKHFLSHTSGIPALGFAEIVIRNVSGATDSWVPGASSADLQAFFGGAEDWVLARPGERWFYLNEGYEMLGAIIEKCSGMSYADYVTKNILEPIGMMRSYYSKAKMDKDDDAATPYSATGEGKRFPSGYAFGAVNAAGGLISNVEDMAKYAAMYLANGKAGDARIASKESLDAMMTPRVTTPPKENPFGDYGYGYGLGVLPNFMGERLVGHSGSVGSATAYMGFIPAKNIGVVVLANGSGAAPSQLGQFGLALVLGKDPETLPFVKTEKSLVDLTGMYETFRGTLKAQVRKAGDFLMFMMIDKLHTETIPLLPLKEEKNRKVFYTFTGGNKLEVEFLLEGDRTTIVYERYAFRKIGKLPS
jgi:CubicO group peptidase (beta-lactamase class C family)